MTNNVIYLATAAKTNDYSADTILGQGAFFTLEKAESFMESLGLSKTSHGLWEKVDNYDVSGEIICMKVQ